MSAGFEKIILLYNPATYEVADVISSYVYRVGVLGGDFSFASAIGLFNSVVNFLLLISITWGNRCLVRHHMQKPGKFPDNIVTRKLAAYIIFESTRKDAMKSIPYKAFAFRYL